MPGWTANILNHALGPRPAYGQPVALLPRTIAIMGEDIADFRPHVLVEEGQQVAAGAPLLRDRRRPEITLTAPASGSVVEIRRGPRRAFEHVVIAPGEGLARDFTLPTALTRENLIALMIEAGVWPALRTRPFERVPRPENPPDALFINAMDTRPHAPDPAAIIGPRAAWFTRGLAAMKSLTAGPVYLCHARGAQLPETDGVFARRFADTYRESLAGTHIHRLHPVGAGGLVWHIAYQDVLALGHLLETGTIWQRRIVGLAGDGLRAPHLVETIPGADLHDLVRDHLADGPVRLISGAPLGGRASRYLGLGHVQVSALRHAPPIVRPPALARALRWLRPENGAIIPNAIHEWAAPPGILPIPFLRAIAVGDIENARRLGALELAEEDLALLAHADGGNADFGRMLRRVLDELEAGQ